MERKSKVYKDVSTRFSFLNRPNLKLNEEEYSRCQFLPGISAWTLMEKCSSFITTSSPDLKKTDFTHAELCDIIVQDKIRSVFRSNLDIALRIFLTFMLTNVSAKQSFSQLKRVKNHTEGQERLMDSLSLLCVEADMLSSVS